MMRIDVLTLFPEMFTLLNHSIVGTAQAKKIIDVNLHNFRDFATNKQKHVDDYPYGGETAGMLLMFQPISENLAAIEVETKNLKKRIILLDPAGEKFTQAKAEEFAKEEQLIFICGHYEGFDERIRTLVTDEVSIGDYILTGGEIPTLAIIDSVSRLLPEVLGNNLSNQMDSHSTGFLEEPQYTRPAEIEGLKVPDILLSGDHEKIRRWRLKEAIRKTYLRRSDLFKKVSLDREMKELFSEILVEEKRST